MSQLFRSEAIDAKRDRWLGKIMLIRPVSFAFLTGMAAAIALLVVLFMVFGKYTKRANVSGVLIPDKGLIRVMPPAQGLVIERRVQEGQAVRAGDVLFVLNTERQGVSSHPGASLGAINTNEAISGTLRERKQSLKDEQASQVQLTEQQRRQQNTRLHDMTVEMTKVEQQIATQKKRVALFETQIRRTRKLVSDGFYADAALLQKEDELLDQRARLQSLEQNQLQMHREIASAKSELDQLTIKAQREQQQLARAVSEIDQADIVSESQRRVVITAPFDGVVSGVMGEPGMAVANQPLATLLPAKATLEAQLFAPSAAAGFIQPGQKVRLRYAAFPYQKFGQYEGVVQSVSRSAISANEVQDILPALTAQGRNESLYRIRVTLNSQSVNVYGKEQKLTSGMQLEADILQDTRRLLEWVFEPVLGLKSSV